MKSAIILHGMPSKEEYYDISSKTQSSSHWLPWIQKQLIVSGILAQTPELPHPYEPKYEDWLDVFKQLTLNEETMLVGHSCGAGFLIRYLSENSVHVGKVALVAPFLDKKYSDATALFFEFIVDKDFVSKTKEVKVFYSTDDEQDILESVKLLKEQVKDIRYVEFTNKGHFTYGTMKTEEFPELKDFLLS